MDYDINQSQQVTEILTDSEDKTVKILDHTWKDVNKILKILKNNFRRDLNSHV